MRQDERSRMMTTQQHLTQFVCRTLFSRRGAISYIGHLDLMKVIERAVRRAELPILYTQGYNPRPMMVFALPLGVGINTTGDYVDVAMSVEVPAEEFLARVRPELPDGLEFISAVNIDEPKNSIMSVVTCATYTLEAPGITRALLKLFEMDEVNIEKKSKKKIVETDIRPLLIKPIPSGNEDRTEVMVYAGSTRNLRCDVLLNAICTHTGYDREAADNCIVTRTALYGGEYPDIVDIVNLV